MSTHGPSAPCATGCGRWTLLTSVDTRCLHCLMEAARARESRLSPGGIPATAAPDAAPLPVVGAVVEDTDAGSLTRAQGAGASPAALRAFALAPPVPRPEHMDEALAVALHGAFVELENDNPDTPDRDASWERLPAAYRRHLVKVVRVALGALRDAGVSL